MNNTADWTPVTTKSTDWSGGRNQETQTKGSPIGLLLAITYSQSVDSLDSISTDWTTTTINSTNWTQT